MSRMETVLKVFVASPSDVAEERALLEEIVRELNITWSKQLGVRLDLVRWETHAFPGMGSDAQVVINEQLEDDYDIFIGIMWKKAGSPTGRAISGTVEEFQRAYEIYVKNPKSMRIMFYFNDTPVPPSEMDPAHLVSIFEFKKTLGEKGALYWPYTSSDEFTTLLRIHLSRQVQGWQKTWGISTTHEIIVQDNIIDELTVDNDETDEGLIDLIELGNEKFENASDAMLRITTAMEELGVKTAETTTAINRVQGIGGQPNMILIKKIVKRQSEEMMQFVARMKPEIPIFKDSFSSGVESMIKVTSISNDFSPSEDDEINNSLETINSLKDSIINTLEAIHSFRESIAATPRITTEYIKAKRESLIVLDSFIEEMTSAINLIPELEEGLVRFRNNFLN